LHTSGGPRPAPGTLTSLFFDAADRFGKPDALKYKENGAWIGIPHAEVVTRARRVALALQSLGVAPGERVGILSENRPEWAIADYGCLTGGLVDVPMYPTLPAEQLPFILNESGCVALFVSTALQAEKIARIRAEIPSVRHVISFVTPAPPGATMTFEELLERGRALESPAVNDAWKRNALSVQPDDLATLIYTSGTTGTPKGVMLSHDNLHSNVEGTRDLLRFTPADVALSFLPLSHVLQRMNDYLAWTNGVTIAYAESFDAVPANLVEVRPTFVVSVPRLYEKMYARVLENALRGGALKKRIFFWARSVANAWATETLAGRTPSALLRFKYRIGQRLVFSKLHARVGGRLRYFVSGGAALAPDINRFFYAAGLVILEGYGLTETSPVIAVNTPQNFRIGTVGKPIAGVDVLIADDGEILTRGPNVTRGYFRNAAATAECFTPDGWFKTGDIGLIEDGYLRITDRKKDLIKTSGGKYIAPQPIENRAKTSKFVADAVVIGEGFNFPSMLIVPNFENLERWSAENGIANTDRATLVRMPAVIAKVEQEVRSTFDGLAKFETPKKFAVLDREFTIERGELTPSLKVRRKTVTANWKATIDAIYQGHDAPLP
jgi:long-chain acyl-CoA synthetase